MSTQAQDYGSHRRWVPLYHYVVMPILLINVVYSIWQAVQIRSGDNAWAAALAVALLIGISYSRIMANKVQDRVIRLEMQIRLRAILTGAVAARISDLTPRQLVGLRFASDAELPALVERCLSGELATGEAIKKQIKNWQADWLRA
jgi:hypothetical protein